MYGFHGKFDLNVPEDVERLAALKAEVKAYNKGSSLKARVMLRGRLGKNNPNAIKYRERGKRWAYRGNPYQTILKEDAAYFMVYVYTR